MSACVLQTDPQTGTVRPPGSGAYGPLAGGISSLHCSCPSGLALCGHNRLNIYGTTRVGESDQMTSTSAAAWWKQVADLSDTTVNVGTAIPLDDAMGARLFLSGVLKMPGQEVLKMYEEYRWV